ncbi:MAG: peptide chain release factor N(5)-glutamine methyltransferase [Dehalococcoidia bacterium]|nr:peptide chain release factor N(5)-glutamine methyltransferase [Dehalococcoidia bacterium]
MTWQDIHRQVASALAFHHIENASFEAELLIRSALNITRAQFYAENNNITNEIPQSLLSMLERRIKGEPFAYISNQREFFGLSFYVDNRVLIPRPETELLVETTLELIKSKYPAQLPVTVDVGTGSGAIAISLASKLPNHRIYATDISPDALEVARINCSRHQVCSRVTLLEGNLLEPLPEPVDIVVANLPYIPRSTYKSLGPEILNFEPPGALNGGENGLFYIFEILEQSRTRLRPGASLLLEIGEEQSTEVMERAHSVFPRAGISSLRDLADKKRAILIENPQIPFDLTIN